MEESIREILFEKAKELDEASKGSKPEVLIACTEEILRIYQVSIQF